MSEKFQGRYTPRSKKPATAMLPVCEPATRARPPCAPTNKKTGLRRFLYFLGGGADLSGSPHLQINVLLSPAARVRLHQRVAAVDHNRNHHHWVELGSGLVAAVGHSLNPRH
jgi:hypothetical protein